MVDCCLLMFGHDTVTAMAKETSMALGLMAAMDEGGRDEQWQQQLQQRAKATMTSMAEAVAVAAMAATAMNGSRDKRKQRMAAGMGHTTGTSNGWQ